MRLLLVSVAMICISGHAAPGIAADAGEVAYGSYLAAQCASCHGAQGSVPSFDSLDVETLAMMLEEYRSGERSNVIMQTVARSLGQREIAALKAHLAEMEVGGE